MAFCTKCGHQIREGHSFCTKCGAPVRKASEPAAPKDEMVHESMERETEAVPIDEQIRTPPVVDEPEEKASVPVDDAVDPVDAAESESDEKQESTSRKYSPHICPMCGDAIPPLQRVCPSCGYELTQSVGSSPVGKLAKRLEKIVDRAGRSSVSYKEAEEMYIDAAQLIRNFQLDDDKDILVDFVMLAEVGVDNVLGESGVKGACAQAILLPAWQLKGDQASKRGRLLYGDKFGDLLDATNQKIHQKADVGIRKAKSRLALFGPNGAVPVGGTILGVVKRLALPIIGCALLVYPAIACVSGHARQSDLVLFELAGLLLLPYGVVIQFNGESGFLEVGISAAICFGLLKFADYADRLGFSSACISIAAVLGLLACLLVLMQKANAAMRSKARDKK